MTSQADTVATFREMIAQLDPTKRAELGALLAPKLKALWLPEPENKPQVRAYCSAADLLLFGGSVGEESLICSLVWR